MKVLLSYHKSIEMNRYICVSKSEKTWEAPPEQNALTRAGGVSSKNFVSSAFVFPEKPSLCILRLPFHFLAHFKQTSKKLQLWCVIICKCLSCSNMSLFCISAEPAQDLLFCPLCSLYSCPLDPLSSQNWQTITFIHHFYWNAIDQLFTKFKSRLLND